MCSTPFGITEVGMMASAMNTPWIESAQRLSASQRWALVRSAHRASDSLVLNAFRHHRGGHVACIAIVPVLRRCSTPFGITEVGIQASRENY